MMRNLAAGVGKRLRQRAEQEAADRIIRKLEHTKIKGRPVLTPKLGKAAKSTKRRRRF